MSGNKKSLFPTFPLCQLAGIATFLVIFFVIPLYVAPGTKDSVWIAMMILVPVLIAILSLGFVNQAKPTCVFGNIPLYIFLTLLFCQKISTNIDIQLGDFSKNLFSWIKFLIYTFGWSIGVTVLQYCALLIMQTIKKYIPSVK